MITFSTALAIGEHGTGGYGNSLTERRHRAGGK
jgi:hypothetical protein